MSSQLDTAHLLQTYCNDIHRELLEIKNLKTLVTLQIRNAKAANMTEAMGQTAPAL